MLKVGHMLLTVLSLVETRITTQPHIPLLEEAEDGVEQHSVVCLPRGVQKLPSGDVIVGADASNETQSAQNLLLGQKNLHDLIISGGEPLQHVQRELVSRWICALQRQQQTGQWFGVAQDVILKKLVQHVEEVVLDQSFDD